MKVLISAYACSPYKGSEPGVGWGFVKELSRKHDLWVIVEEEKFRDDIEQFLVRNPDFGQRVHFFFLRKKRKRLLRKIWPPSYYWFYRLWHVEAYVLAKRLHEEIDFDLVHQLTMVGFREPGYLWRLGIPFVWGPIGGMGLFPWRLLSEVGWYGALYYISYNLFNYWQMHFLQRSRIAARKAGVGLLTATPENKRGAEKYWKCSSTVISEVGLPLKSNAVLQSRLPIEAIRIIWIGSHTPGKALPLAFKALSSLPAYIDWELYILGHGPCTSAWHRKSESLNVANRCHFHGWLPREEALRVMGSGHLMLITSLRDLTSTVTIEALALGVPIVCMDHCGFSAVVDETCGIKVPVTTPSQVISGFASAITRLANDETLRYTLARGAVKKAQDYSWRKKGEMLEQIYRQKVGEQRAH